jgi:acyl-CoA thioester hydrolase
MLQAFEWPVRVYYEDTDTAGIVYHANYLKFMERARTEWLRALGFEQDQLARVHGIGFVVTRATLNFRRPARFNDALRTTCLLTRCGRASLELAQDVLSMEGELLCGGEIKVGCVTLRGMGPARMPAEILERLNHAL